MMVLFFMQTVCQKGRIIEDFAFSDGLLSRFGQNLGESRLKILMVRLGYRSIAGNAG